MRRDNLWIRFFGGAAWRQAEEEGPAWHLNQAAVYLLAAAASYQRGGKCHVDRHLKETEDSVERFLAERGNR